MDPRMPPANPGTNTFLFYLGVCVAELNMRYERTDNYHLTKKDQPQGATAAELTHQLSEWCAAHAVRLRGLLADTCFILVVLTSGFGWANVYDVFGIPNV